jgi:hypothetical protein
LQQYVQPLLSFLGAFGGEIDTPNLDQLAKPGTILSNFYVLGSGVQDLSRCPSGRVQDLSCAALLLDKSCSV